MGAGRFTKVLLRELVAARQHRFKKRRFVRRRPQLLLQHRIGENRCWIGRKPSIAMGT
jgi:hypothetical protein